MASQINQKYIKMFTIRPDLFKPNGRGSAGAVDKYDPVSVCTGKVGFGVQHEKKLGSAGDACDTGLVYLCVMNVMDVLDEIDVMDSMIVVSNLSDEIVLTTLPSLEPIFPVLEQIKYGHPCLIKNRYFQTNDCHTKLFVKPTISNFLTNLLNVLRNTKSVLKLTLLMLNTAGCYAVYFIGYVLLHAVRQPYQPWRNIMLKRWGIWSLSILQINLKVEGTIPKPPFYLVSNHLSYIDIIVYYALLDVTMVSKIEVRSWPFLGFMSKTFGVIFIDRHKRSDIERVNEQIAQNIHQYQGLLVFPEGTTSDGREVLRFRPSLMKVPIDQQLPVSSAAVSYRIQNAPDQTYCKVCWWGGATLLEHFFELGRQGRIEAVVRFSDERLLLDDRKDLANRLHEEVTSMYIPTEVPEDCTFVPLKI